MSHPLGPHDSSTEAASDASAWLEPQDVDAPARVLCRMSIAALVEGAANNEVNSSSGSGSDTSTLPTSPFSAADDSDVAVSPPQPSVRHPLNRMTQEMRHRLVLKRPAPTSVTELVADMGVSSEDDEDDDDDDDDDDIRSVRSGSGSRSRSSSPAVPKPRKSTQKPITKKARWQWSAPSMPPPPPAASPNTLIVFQPTCLDHHNDQHQENRARLTALAGPDGVLHKPRFRSLEWADLRALRPVRMADMLRVHSFSYIQHLEKSCGALPAQSDKITVGPLHPLDGDDDDEGASLPYHEWLQSPHAQRCFEVEHPPSSGHFDSDSPISRSSYLAARLAAGAVCHAIDQVVHRSTRNAFVVVRPPGHHAGPNGCVDSQGFHRRPEMCTCGFCLLNNIAIGAAYALHTYGPAYAPSVATPERATIQRIAIVDFDIHHGNGTEEIIRNLVPHEQRYPLPASWAPLSFASYQPWRDERDVDNVFFASIHLFDGDDFYPGSGVGPSGDSAELQQRSNILNLPLDFLGPKYLEDRERLSMKAKRALMEKASKTFRDRVTRQLVPALRRFQPDLILLSAGFDGHADDFYYFLTEDDYAWITDQLTSVASDCCDGRLVSVLEGGYNVEPALPTGASAARRKISSSKKSTSSIHAAAKMNNRDVDEELTGYGSLARSCAAHVAALQRAAAA